MKTLLAAAFAALFAVPAWAQPRNCMERSKAINTLQERHGETRQALGLASGNVVMEMFANLETGTWTLLATLPNGMTCLVAIGGEYTPTNESLPGQL